MTGLYFEDWEPGRVIEHALRRTVTETDNLLITTLTMNAQPLHLDAEFGRDSIHGARIVNSIFTLGLVVGIPVSETTLGTTLGVLAFEETTFPAPVFIGDTLRVQTTALDKRRSKSRPEAGVVRIRHEAHNQHDVLVCRCTRAALFAVRDPAGDGDPQLTAT